MLESVLHYLSDFLMFTPQIWARLVARYQQEIWPLQPFALLLGGYLVWLIYFRPKHSDRIINAGLSISWLWVAIVFHINYFTTISWAAWGFGGLFIIQGLMILCFGVLFSKLNYQSPMHFNITNKIGVLLITFTLVVLPLLTAWQGQRWTQAEFFALSPDATALATIGFVLCTKPAVRGLWLILPLLWGFISVAQRLVI